MNDHQRRLLFTELEKIKTSIQELKKPTQWLDIPKAVEYSSCSRSTILSGIQSGNLKHVKTTGKIRLKISWIDQWLITGNCKKQPAVKGKFGYGL
jgi:hypothetical protein